MFREILFSKVDLDTIATSLVLGINPLDQKLHCKGSASENELSDSSTLCIEVGGSGRISENNFDHHESSSFERIPDLSACAQALERLACLIRYVDEVDRGMRPDVQGAKIGFPTLVQLVSGMKLIVKDPEVQLAKGLEIFRTVLQAGIDPYGCMDIISRHLPEAQEWIQAKREHEQLFEEVCTHANCFTTENGINVAVVETSWIGVPGALYGKGADLVIVFNPSFEQSGKIIKKFTVAARKESGLKVSPALSELNKLEKGWGGPAHGTIIGSPTGKSSNLSLTQVTNIVVACVKEQRPTLRLVG